MIPSSPFLCVITDEALCPVAVAEQALKGGAAMIQLRHKRASGSQLFAWAVEIRNQCQKYQALFIINDRVDIAMASKADGVHLGQQDLPALVARKLLGKECIIGISASSLEEALRAEKDGANYIGFGHIYPTLSKEKGFPPLGTEALLNAAAFISLPIIAIGGVSLENASSLISCGATGVAVISAVSRTDDPARAASELVAALKRKKS
ncbi:MAG: thiamine phosphate synthase [Chlorobiaceae bacterium]